MTDINYDWVESRKDYFASLSDEELSKAQAEMVIENQLLNSDLTRVIEQRRMTGIRSPQYEALQEKIKQSKIDRNLAYLEVQSRKSDPQRIEDKISMQALEIKNLHKALHEKYLKLSTAQRDKLMWKTTALIFEDLLLMVYPKSLLKELLAESFSDNGSYDQKLIDQNFLAEERDQILSTLRNYYQVD